MINSSIVFIDLFTLFKDNLEFEISKNTLNLIMDEFVNIKNIKKIDVLIFSFYLSKEVTKNDFLRIYNKISYLKYLINLNNFVFGDFIYMWDSYSIKDFKFVKEIKGNSNITENVIKYVKDLSAFYDLDTIYVIDENASTFIYYDKLSTINVRRIKEENIDIPLIVFMPSIFNLKDYDRKIYGEKDNFFMFLSNNYKINGVLDCIVCYRDNCLEKKDVLSKKIEFV